jgi:hypothetical protein
LKRDGEEDDIVMVMFLSSSIRCGFGAFVVLVLVKAERGMGSDVGGSMVVDFRTSQADVEIQNGRKKEKRDGS